MFHYNEKWLLYVERNALGWSGPCLASVGLGDGLHLVEFECGAFNSNYSASEIA
jgi:hypothetical protein